MKPEKTKRHKRRRKVLLSLLLVVAVGLSVLSFLSYGPVKTLASLEKVDDFPLYVMRFQGTYLFDFFAEEGIDGSVYRKIYETINPNACISFAALNPEGEGVFGRNFDWKNRASLLLFTDPPNGYASVSMVDIYYLGLEGMQEIPWAKRLNLLAAPYVTIDGMNEWGVAIAQNAVPPRQLTKDPNKPTLLSSHLVRLVLDHARDTDEAVDLIQRYNLYYGGPLPLVLDYTKDTDETLDLFRKYNTEFVIPVHFHIADASGNSAIVEYVDGRIAVTRNDSPWQVSTNFLVSEVQPVGATSDCWRYNTAYESLSEADGDISQDEAIRLLERTSQDSTVWSIVYNLSTGEIQVAMGKDYEQLHTFKLEMKSK